MSIVEVCIASDNAALHENVVIAYLAGAQRIELCSAMDKDGLTPSVAEIKVARQAFAERPGLMVMIRPRAGDFCYNSQEVQLMAEQIKQAAQAGANGVVLGALTEDGSELDLEVLQHLVALAKSFALEVGVHRAFDVLLDCKSALQQLKLLNVDRVLTSGSPWGTNNTAVVGMTKINQLLEIAQQQIEIVIAGGVSPAIIDEIIKQVMVKESHFSVHAFSGVLDEQQKVCRQKVMALVMAD